MAALPPEIVWMPGVTDAVPGSQSWSWSITPRFYRRHYRGLMPNCSLIHSLSLFLPNYPGFILIFKPRKVESGHFSSCWECLLGIEKNLDILLTYQSLFLVCTLVTWSVFWNNSSSKTLRRGPQEKNRWTLYSSSGQKRDFPYLYQSVNQRQNTPFHFSRTVDSI